MSWRILLYKSETGFTCVIAGSVRKYAGCINSFCKLNFYCHSFFGNIF